MPVAPEHAHEGQVEAARAGGGGEGATVSDLLRVVAAKQRELASKQRELAEAIEAVALRLGGASGAAAAVGEAAQRALPLALLAPALTMPPVPPIVPAPALARPPPPAPPASLSLLGLPDDVLQRHILPFLIFHDGIVLSGICRSLREHVMLAPWADTDTPIIHVRRWRAAFPKAEAAYIQAHANGYHELTDYLTISLRGMRKLKLSRCNRLSLSVSGYANWSSLRSLTLCNVSYDFGSGIAQVYQLEELNASTDGGEFSEKMMAGIARLPFLRVLRLTGKSHGIAAAFKEAPHAHLRSLFLCPFVNLNAEFLSHRFFRAASLSSALAAMAGKARSNTLPTRCSRASKS